MEGAEKQQHKDHRKPQAGQKAAKKKKAQGKWKQVGPLGITACTEHAEIIAKAQPVDQAKKPRHQPAHAAVLPLFPTKDIEPAAQEYGEGDAPFDPALPLFHKGGWRPGEGQ